MKFKEIEDSLKKERGEVNVPNVFSRVKKAPINRLLSPPLQVFRKQAAIRLLAFAFVLFLAVTLAMISMFSMPASVKDDAAYLYVRIQNGDGEYSYGIIVRGEKAEFVCAESSPNGNGPQNLNLNGIGINEAINALYSAKSEDKISISAISDSDVAKSRAYSLVKEAFYKAGAICEIAEGASAAQTKTQLINFVNGNGGEVDASMSAEEIIAEYVARLSSAD